MGRVTRRIFKTRINIGLFKVGEVLQGPASSRRQAFQAHGSP